MKKIGIPFSRDMEFTGCCDIDVIYRMQARSLKNFSHKGSGLVLETATDSEDKVAVIELNNEQKKMVQEVTGKKAAKVEITLTCSSKAQEIPLTAEQQEAVEKVLGIKVTGLSVSRKPIEVAIK